MWAAAAAASVASGGVASATPLERSALRTLSKTALGFEIVSLAFCPADSTLLLVAGLRAAAVLTVSPRGEVSVRLPLDLGLETPTASSPPPSLLRALWAPGVAPCVGLLSGGPAGWVKLYDLRRHRGAPFAHLAPPDEPLKDVTFATDAAAGPEAASPGLVVLAMSGVGTIYTHRFPPLPAAAAAPAPASSSIPSSAALPAAAPERPRPTVLSSALAVPAELRSRLGVTLHYSPPCDLLFTSFADGRAFVLRLDAARTRAVRGCPLHPVLQAASVAAAAGAPCGGSGGAGSAVGPGGNSGAPQHQASHAAAVGAGAAPAGLAARCVPHSHWRDVPGCRGLLTAACRKTLQPLLLCVTPAAIEVQPLRPSTRIEGIAAAAAPAHGAAARAPSAEVAAVCWARAPRGCAAGGCAAHGASCE